MKQKIFVISWNSPDDAEWLRPSAVKHALDCISPTAGFEVYEFEGEEKIETPIVLWDIKDIRCHVEEQLNLPPSVVAKWLDVTCLDIYESLKGCRLEREMVEDVCIGYREVINA